MPAALDHQIQEIGEAAKALEVYRYVRLNDLLSHPFTTPSARAETSQGPSDALVFVNGRFSSEHSSPPEGVVALPLEEALITYGGFLRARLSQWKEREQDPFARLNGELFREALFLYIPPKMEVELTVLHQISTPHEPTLLNPRLHVFVGKGAQLKLRERQQGAKENIWINQVADLALEAHASVTSIAEEKSHPAGWHFNALRATLKEGSLFKSYSVTHGYATSREDYRIDLLEEGSEAALYGMWDLKGRCHHHVNVWMEHHAPHCISLQKFKGVLADTSRSSFEGKIYVHKEAQKTEAYQMNHNLILGKRAAAYTKPNLEIFADDVKASHGATVGQLDPEHLFYLKTRGIPEQVAHKLLVQGFTQEILSLIP